jgi:hypothetical protein
LTEEESRKAREALLEEARKAIEELEPAEGAYERLHRKLRNFILNAEYRMALQILEADPGFVKYHNHPKWKSLHGALIEALARERRREEDNVPDPARPADAAARGDARNDAQE